MPPWQAMGRGPMTFGLLFVFVALVRHVRADDQPAGGVPAPGSLVNCGFEDGRRDEAPAGWMAPKLDGYQVLLSDEQPQAGKHCALIESQSPRLSRRFGNLMQGIDATPFRGRRVRFRGAVRAEVAGAGNQAHLWFRVDRRSEAVPRPVGAFDNMADRPITGAQWRYYDIVGDVSDDADKIFVGLILMGQGKAWIDDVSLDVVDQDVGATAKQLPERRSLDQLSAGLFEIAGSRQLAPNAAFLRTHRAEFASGVEWKNHPVTMLIPLPLAYRDQAPLGYEFVVEPPHADDSFEIYEDTPHNHIVRLILADVLNRGAIQIGFRSTILVGDTAARPPVEAAMPAQWPEEAAPWLQATWCVDADHARIQAIAKEIRDGTDDVMLIIARVEQRAKQIFQAAEGRVGNLTAVDALDKRGSCTSCGNLVAALLRASGVPARVLSGYPSWTGPLQTHYLVEAYAPNYGWYPIESTLCRSPWPNTHQVHVAIIPPEYEVERLAGRRVSAAGGVPYLSLTEWTDRDGTFLSRGTIEGAPNCDHVCKMLRKIEAPRTEWKSAIEKCQKRWKTWLHERHQLSAAGKVSFGKTSDELIAKSLDGLRAP